jgi:hypothetical protein
MGDSAIDPARPSRLAAFARRGWSFHLRIVLFVGIGALAIIAIFPWAPSEVGVALARREPPVLWGIEGTETRVPVSLKKVDRLEWTQHGVAVGALEEPQGFQSTYRWDDFQRSGWRVVANYDVQRELDEVAVECASRGTAMPALERARSVFVAFGLPDFGAKLGALHTLAETNAGRLQLARADRWEWDLTARLAHETSGDVELLRARRARTRLDGGTESVIDEFDRVFPGLEGIRGFNNRGEWVNPPR